MISEAESAVVDVPRVVAVVVVAAAAVVATLSCSSASCCCSLKSWPCRNFDAGCCCNVYSIVVAVAAAVAVVAVVVEACIETSEVARSCRKSCCCSRTWGRQSSSARGTCCCQTKTGLSTAAVVGSLQILHQNCSGPARMNSDCGDFQMSVSGVGCTEICSEMRLERMTRLKSNGNKCRMKI